MNATRQMKAIQCSFLPFFFFFDRYRYIWSRSVHCNTCCVKVGRSASASTQCRWPEAAITTAEVNNESCCSECCFHTTRYLHELHTITCTHYQRKYYRNRQNFILVSCNSDPVKSIRNTVSQVKIPTNKVSNAYIHFRNKLIYISHACILFE